jgi:hypothetical protein
MTPSETRFEIVPVPVPLDACNGARVIVVANVLGTATRRAGVQVLADGRQTGVEAYTNEWSPDLTLVETLAVSDASALTVKAIGDAVVLRAVARPFSDPQRRGGTEGSGRARPPRPG